MWTTTLLTVQRLDILIQIIHLQSHAIHYPTLALPSQRRNRVEQDPRLHLMDHVTVRFVLPRGLAPKAVLDHRPETAFVQALWQMGGNTLMTIALQDRALSALRYLFHRPLSHELIRMTHVEANEPASYATLAMRSFVGLVRSLELLDDHYHR